MHIKNRFTAGKSLHEAEKVLIMIHGRGGSAADIARLADHLDTAGFAIVAPQATAGTWYPNSFIAPLESNEPWLSSAIDQLDELLDELQVAGIAPANIYFLGFSQGACLCAEFVARRAQRFGGVVIFTGGLIGEKIGRERYAGDFAGTPFFIGTSDPDFHVPVERVRETARIFREMNAEVTEKVYLNRGHTISQDEIDQANSLVFSV